ncbi:hypothetical protein V6Z11_D12G028600 [Gossypium hirsutum]
MRGQCRCSFRMICRGPNPIRPNVSRRVNMSTRVNYRQRRLLMTKSVLRHHHCRPRKPMLKWKSCLIKRDMSGHKNSSINIQTFVALMIRTYPKKHTLLRTILKFTLLKQSQVWIAGTPKHF